MSSPVPSLLPPPPGTNYIAVIKPAVNIALVGTIWTSFLVPMAVLLFFFSTSYTRRQPIFILNIVVIVLGIVAGILNAWLEIANIFGENNEIWPQAYTVKAAIQASIPLLVDIILLLRLAVVYSPRHLTWTRTLAIYTLPIVIKIARVVSISLFFVHYSKALRKGAGPAAAGQTLWGEQPWTKIEWFLQLVDNAFMSCMFLYRIRASARIDIRVDTIPSSNRASRYSYSARLKSLFWIAVSNFVFPSLFNLALIIYVFRSKNSLYGAYLDSCNTYIQIIGVLSATVWANGMRWSMDNLHGAQPAAAPVDAIAIAPGLREGLPLATATIQHSVALTTDPGTSSTWTDSSYDTALGRVDLAKRCSVEEEVSRL